MGARERIAAGAAAHLASGEVVQGVFAGQTSKVFRMFDRYRTVVATDRRILVFDSGLFSQSKTGELLSELPRQTRLGPSSGLWHDVETPTGTLWVNRRYHRDLEAIDALAR